MSADWVGVAWAVVLVLAGVVVLVLLLLAALPEARQHADDADARAEAALRVEPNWVPLSIREERAPFFGRIAWAHGAGYVEAREAATAARLLAKELAWARGEPASIGADDAVADLLRGITEPVRRYGVDLAGVDVSALGPCELLAEARRRSPARSDG